MDHFQLLTDLHKDADRQGPGGETETIRAMDLAGLDMSRHLKIADIGCGTGASTLLLARKLNASITAVDLFPVFLDELQSRAHDGGVADKISTLACSMDSLPFSDEEFDVIWSEGAIYNMGFEDGLSRWRRFLKPGGMLIVSEITWLTAARPPMLQLYWQKEYPEIAAASTKIEILERNGYKPEAYFILPKRCWLENYYRPMQGRFDEFLERHNLCEEAKNIVASEKNEIAIYEKNNGFYGYGFYVARKAEG